MIPFNPQGPTITFTAATTAPTPVQCLSTSGQNCEQYFICNTGSVEAFLAFGTTSATAAANAVIPTSTPSFVMPIAPLSTQTLTLPPNAYMTAITSSSTAVFYVTPGYGE